MSGSASGSGAAAGQGGAGTPLVSCLMPTHGRRPFVPHAIRYFLRQSYANRELVILDDGPDPVADLIPDDARIRYVRLTGRQRTLGAKRNFACEEARGDILLHWDDDDWMAARRIAVQVEALLEAGADACGLDRLLFLQASRPAAWQYVYCGTRRTWLAGGTLCYTREAWRRHPFPHVRAGEDTRFVWSRAIRRSVALPDSSFYVALIHDGNTSPKRTRGRAWRPQPIARVRALLGEDWELYSGDGSSTVRPASRPAPAPVRSARPRPSSRPARAGGRSTADAIPLLFWTGLGATRGNFGDMLSPLIVRALSGRPTRYERGSPKLIAVGSLLKCARRGDRVWGSGFMHPNDSCDPRVRVSAVRGPSTRRKLLALGADCPEIYGDPGLLLPWLYRLPAHARRGIGIIPHYVDAKRVSALARDPGVRVIDVLGGVEKVLDQVSRCEVLLSSSLHGCVVGDAYGIPTAWARISDRVGGGAFKFDDYYAGTGREAKYVDWRRGIDLDAGVRAALAVPRPQLDLESLLRAFPFRRPELQELADLTPRELARPPEAVTSSKRTAWRSAQPPSLSGWTLTAAPGGRAEPSVSHASRLAVFSSGTEDYLPYMVTAMRSFSRHADQPPMDYYALGHAFSDRSRELLRSFGIGYVDLDLTATFERRARSPYPSECFWIFKGPQIFHTLGYDYSLSIDGDVWCNRALDLDWLPRVEHLAGVDRGSTVGQFLSALGGYRLLREHFGIRAEADRRRATQSGVVFYNNRALADLGFFERIADVYTRSEALGVRRRGDDSTLALLLAVHPDIQLLELDDTWNAYRGMRARVPRRDATRAKQLARWQRDARIVHFAGVKPWARLGRFPNPVAEHFSTAWRGLWREVDLRPQTPVPERARRGGARQHRARNDSRYPVRCYWYRGSQPNFGDELAPYLIRKVAGLPPGRRLAERPPDPRRLAEPVLLSVGSILRLCGRNAVVWGSGIRHIDQEVAPAKRFVAVRGPLTRRRLLRLGYDCPPLYGDPGLLLPRYYRPAVPEAYALGIIPHQVDYPRLAKLYGREPGVLVIDVRTTDIEDLVRQVLSCASTVSSALHGLVVSVAYGIPTRWLRASTRITGDGSKFYDFFASLNPAVAEALDAEAVALPGQDEGLDAYRPIDMMESVIPPRELIEATRHHQITLDLDALLEACPVTAAGWKPHLRPPRPAAAEA